MPKSSIARSHAERLELLQPRDRELDVVHHHALGDLEDEAARVEAGRPGGPPRPADDVGRWSWRAERLTDMESGVLHAARPSAAWRSAAGLPQDPAAELDDLPVSSASGMNDSGRHHPALRDGASAQAPRRR